MQDRSQQPLPALKPLLQAFISSETSGGIVLFVASLAALVLANSPLAENYVASLSVEVAGLSVLHWINDGLMAIFFLLVALEVKREVLVGELSTWKRRYLPGAAAIAGMAVPALVFIAINSNEPQNLRGWAIPAATDIAFALAVLALVGSRVPVSLKVLLTTIAIVDDLLAITAIALFYTDELAVGPLGLAALGLAVLFGLNRARAWSVWPYLLVGVGIWYCVLLSGIHATLAGVVVALTIPLRDSKKAATTSTESPLERLERTIQPWVAFLVVPVFGFANAGISFANVALSDALAPLPLGIAVALVIGKQAAVFGTIFILVRLGLAHLPSQVSWRHIYGVALLCGIGFTISLFIGGLAFDGNPERVNAVKIGVFSGSLLSGLIGYAILRSGRKPQERAR